MYIVYRYQFIEEIYLSPVQILQEVQIKLEEAERKREKLEKANQSLELLTKNQEEAIAKKDKASAVGLRIYILFILF